MIAYQFTPSPLMHNASCAVSRVASDVRTMFNALGKEFDMSQDALRGDTLFGASVEQFLPMVNEFPADSFATGLYFMIPDYEETNGKSVAVASTPYLLILSVSVDEDSEKYAPSGIEVRFGTIETYSEYGCKFHEFKEARVSRMPLCSTVEMMHFKASEVFFSGISSIIASVASGLPRKVVA
jgi:hypothetical protein